ncbi:MAG: baseplate J/gp47 family protein [Lachnospiraceae bacterium]|nr:baseplate J/gp47 family protein [Lachnospiraceae bacterium]
MEMKTVFEYPEVSFIDNMSVEDMSDFYIEEMQKKYRELTGRDLILHDSDPIRLMAYTNCLLLYQIAQYADRAGKMALLKYSYGDYLGNIGALKGIARNQGAAAKVRLRFTLSSRRPGTTIIRAGIRVTSSDGVYFQTTDILEIPAGQIEGEVNAECREIGSKGNGYEAGMIKTLVDPVAYVEKVENITVSEGGADLESDENLAERIFLAPASWSTAGPDDAYKYWVRTFNPAITDVMVGSDIPGEVDIFFILQDGQLPEETMIEELEQYLKNEEVRPLTDQVIVRAPEIQKYKIDLTYYINRSDRSRVSAINDRVQEAVQSYIVWQREKIGRDINPDQLRKMLLLAGAKRLEIREPQFSAIAQASIALPAGKIAVLYGGIEDD